MRREFVEGTVYPWPMLDTKAGKSLLLDAFMPAATGRGAASCAPRVGLGPRLLYVMGGRAGDAAVEIFDPQTNSWTAGVALPDGRSHAAAAANWYFWMRRTNRRSVRRLDSRDPNSCTVQLRRPKKNQLPGSIQKMGACHLFASIVFIGRGPPLQNTVD